MFSCNHTKNSIRCGYPAEFLELAQIPPTPLVIPFPTLVGVEHRAARLFDHRCSFASDHRRKALVGHPSKEFDMKTTSTTVALPAQLRTTIGKGLGALRREGTVPARIYGHGASVPIQLEERILLRQRELHQLAGVIELAIEGQTEHENVLVSHIDFKPGTGRMQHVDFIRVLMNEPIHARVPLHFIGESEAARLNNGVVIPLIEAIDVTSLPKDLPDSVTVDISKLTTLDLILHASDIDLPAGVTLRISPDEAIAKVQAQRGATAAETAAAATAVPEKEA